MSRMQRWLLVGVVVAVAAFVQGLVGGLTGSAPAQPVPAVSESPAEG